MHIGALLQESAECFKNAKTLDEKFAHLNTLIELEHRDEKYYPLLYAHIKSWLKYYVQSVARKKFSYDEVVYEKVFQKISYLSTKEEQLNITNFFIRYLSQNHLLEKLPKYKELKKKLELDIFLEKKEYGNYLFKRSIYDLKSLFLTLLLSIALFALIFYILQDKCAFFSIQLVQYTDNTYWNYFGNVLAYIFSINNTLEFQTISELIFMGFLKIYFYILITYFIVKEISNKVEKIW